MVRLGAAVLLVCLLPVALGAAAGGAPSSAPTGSQLAALAKRGDAVELWRAATETAAAAVVAALKEQEGGSVELQVCVLGVGGRVGGRIL